MAFWGNLASKLWRSINRGNRCSSARSSKPWLLGGREMRWRPADGVLGILYGGRRCRPALTWRFCLFEPSRGREREGELGREKERCRLAESSLSFLLTLKTTFRSFHINTLFPFDTLDTRKHLIVNININMVVHPPSILHPSTPIVIYQ